MLLIICIHWMILIVSCHSCQRCSENVFRPKLSIETSNIHLAVMDLWRPKTALVATNHFYVMKFFLSIMNLLSPLPENELSLMKLEKKSHFSWPPPADCPMMWLIALESFFFLSFFQTANLTPRINLNLKFSLVVQIFIEIFILNFIYQLQPGMTTWWNNPGQIFKYGGLSPSDGPS